jgi:hypothetical protein
VTDPTETVVVWIDDGGLLRRMSANANFGQLMSVAATIDFSDYGINPQIDLPPASRVDNVTA